MSILPLPQFEADLEAAQRADREHHAKMAAPETVVVRFGKMKLIGEYRYDGDVKPGCGSKILVKTHRGTEIGELLTSTCPNAGCSKSVTRKQMLEYIENSGGSDYPFYTDGKALRVATVEELQRHNALDEQEPELRRRAQGLVDGLRLPMKVVQAEPILGGERLTLYFISEERVDFRELLEVLRSEFRTRIDLRHVGARDEARLIADYERCGQHCCCKQFLKVLKPVSMRSAKQQKATLDPLKISGRCGRLMCCLRYEDETYRELDKKLPKMGKRVGTPHGIGQVVDRQILTQLVLVRLEEGGQRVAVPVEEVVKPEDVASVLGKASDPMRGLGEQHAAGRVARRNRPTSKDQQQDAYRERAKHEGDGAVGDVIEDAAVGEAGSGRVKKKRRRRKGSEEGASAAAGQERGAKAQGEVVGDAAGSPTRKKKKRRRKARPDAGPDAMPDAKQESAADADAQQGTGDRLRRRRRSGSGSGSGSGERSASDGSASAEGSGSSLPRKKRRRRRRPGGGAGGGDGPSAGPGSGPTPGPPPGPIPGNGI